MKKICENALNWFQIYNYQGDVRQCCWTRDGYIGNLQKNSIEEIYHGEKAEQIRKRLEAGDYSLCDVDACPYLAMNEIEKHLIEYDEAPQFPTELYLGFERVCNYACTCCTVHKFMQEEKKEDLELYYKKIEERIMPILPYVKKISANGCGELFCSKHILNILSNWKPMSNPEDIEVLLESNGSLFDEEHWKQIENLGEYNLRVAISVMSFEEPVYQYLSGTKLPITKVENNLKFIRSLREAGIINYFEIATVVQEKNFRSIPKFVQKCIEGYNPDYIRLRPYEPWGAQSPEEVWITDVRNPEHPYYEEYKKVMQHPILNHPLVHDWSGGLDVVNRLPFPYKKELYKLKIVSEIYEDESGLLDYLQQTSYCKGIVIYGLAEVGKALVNKSREYGFDVAYIIDQNNKQSSYKGIPIVSLEKITDEKKEECVIITPLLDDKQVKQKLLNKNYCNIISVRELVNDRLLSDELKEL